MGINFRIAPESKWYIALLAATATFPAVATDSCLPSLPEIGHSLHTQTAATVTILTVFLGGFTLGQLAIGPLSDCLGRRPALVAGCLFFALGAGGCATAPSLSSLVFWRFMQGLGAAAGPVIASAMVRDLFTGDTARTRLAYISVMAAVAPVISPTLGGLLAAATGWRSVFLTLAIGGGGLVIVLSIGLEESLQVRDPKAILPLRLLSNYWQVLSHPTCLLYSLVGGLSFGTLFAYISGSAFVFIDFFRMDVRVYGLLFAINALAIGAGALISGRLTARAFPANRLILIGILVAFCGNASLLAFALAGKLTVVSIMPLLLLNTFSSGLITPNATHGALAPLPRMAGVASSAFFTFRMLGGAIASEMVAFWYRGTPVAMAVTMALFATCSLAAGAVLWCTSAATRPNPELVQTQR